MITIASVIVSLLIGWYFGRNWESLNSVSDIGIAYDKAKEKVDDLRASVAVEVDKLEAKAAELKARL